MGSRKRTLDQRLFGGGPKRLLAIDGGGVRGIVSAGILAEIERRLMVRSGRADFRLSEYFDLIGGTSTGAILAASLAMGKTCAEAADLYRQIAPEPSGGKGKAAGIRRPRFDAHRLEDALARALGDHEMGSPALKTGLAIFTRRVDTGAAWTVTNNPRSRFWDGAQDGAASHRRLMVRKVVQASAAAPTMFEELGLKLDPDNAAVANASGLFVDGAIAGLNNPALQLFKVATLKSYGFEWPAGEDQILMISIGAGYWRQKLDVQAAGGPLEDIAPVAMRAVEALRTVIHDTGIATVATMQALSRPPRPWRIDGEVEEMRDDHLSPFPLLTFQRMDVTLDGPELAGLSFDMPEAEVARLRDAQGDPAVVDRLHEIGLRTGQSYFRTAPGRDARDWDSLILPSRFDPAFFAERALGQPKTRLDAMGRFFERPPRPGE